MFGFAFGRIMGNPDVPADPFRDNFRLGDITGQSLPILEDLDFAGVDDACSLSHFHPPSHKLKPAAVNCDRVVLRAMLSLGHAIRLSAREAVGK